MITQLQWKLLKNIHSQIESKAGCIVICVCVCMAEQN